MLHEDGLFYTYQSHHRHHHINQAPHQFHLSNLRSYRNIFHPQNQAEDVEQTGQQAQHSDGEECPACKNQAVPRQYLYL